MVNEFAFLGFEQEVFESVEVDHSRRAGVASTLISAEAGFGEETWVDDNPDACFSVAISGGSVQRIGGPRSGCRSGVGSNWALVAKGVPTHFVCDDPIVFGQIFITDQVLTQIAGQFELPSLAGQLRDDLIFVADQEMEHRLRRYVLRAFDKKIPSTALEQESSLFLVLDRLYWLQQIRGNSASRVHALPPRRLAKVDEFMRDHLERDIRLEQLASLLGYSVKHFARAFRQTTGMPPHRYLVQLRIDRARELLEQTNNPLSDVAAACGFADQSHFTAAFRRAVGVTPGDYRRTVQP